MNECMKAWVNETGLSPTESLKIAFEKSETSQINMCTTVNTNKKLDWNHLLNLLQIQELIVPDPLE